MLAGVVFFHEYCKSNNQINIFSLLKLILKKGEPMKQEPYLTGKLAGRYGNITQPNKFLSAFKSNNTNTKTLQMYE